MASAEPIAVTLDGGAGGRGLRVEWDVDRVRALTGGAAERSWRLDGEIDWTRTDALRVLSVAFEDGGLLALAGLRPAGASGHDAEAVGAVLVEAEGAAPVELERALVSTEYDGAGHVVRIGLELYTNAAERPARASAERQEQAAKEGDRMESESIPLSFRMDGKRGAGLLEVMRGG